MLDDHFPVKHGKKLKFCRTKNDDIWAMLIEKGYAKIFGAYWNIGLGGAAVNGLKDLTGAPSEVYKLAERSDEEIWERIEDAARKRHIMIASSKSEKNMVNNGIAPWHAYVLAQPGTLLWQ